jgi:hypothetical protein
MGLVRVGRKVAALPALPVLSAPGLALAALAALALALAGCSTSDSGEAGAGADRDRLAPAGQEPDRPAPRPTATGAADGTSSSAPTGGTSAPPPTTSPFSAPSADPLVEALAGELAGAAPDGPRPLSMLEARCVSAGMITQLGPETLARLGAPGGAAGVQPGAAARAQPDVGSLAPAEKQAFADAVLACLDLRRLFSDPFGGAVDLPIPAVECIVSALDREGTLVDILRQAVLEGTDPALAAPRLVGSISNALHRCLSPDELDRLDLGR